MIKDVVIHKGLLNIATGTFVRMGRHSENPLAAEGLVLVSVRPAKAGMNSG
jgi:hypothetical protein